MVVWAHHILGLSVWVRLEPTRDEHRFGSSSEEIIIDAFPRNKASAREPSITLLSTSTRGTLFKMTAEPDEEAIDATLKRPARGYGKRMLDKTVSLEDGREKVMLEMVLMATAFAICVSKLLYVKDGIIEFDDELGDDADTKANTAGSLKEGKSLKHEVSERQIHEAACLLFDDRTMKKKLVDEYVLKYSGRRISRIEEPPKSVSAIIQDWSVHEEEWKDLLDIARQLSVVILAFAHVLDLEACSGLPICEHTQLLGQLSLAHQIYRRGGGARPLYIGAEIWFETIALLMVGYKAASDWSTSHTSDRGWSWSTSLISDRGWSMYVSTFGDANPSHTSEYIGILSPQYR